MIRLLSCALALVATAVPALAQDLHPPADWRVRADDGAADDSLHFVEMPPGWHVTTGPGALLWNPATTAAGAFDLEMEAVAFPGDGAGGYGLFFGGQGLEGTAADHFVFVVDREGHYWLYHRAGPEIHEIVPWTAHSAVAAVPPDGGEAVNVLAVTVRPDSLSFRVNGETVTSFPRPSYFQADGQVGLRVDAGMNVHVTRLEVTSPDLE